MSEDYSGQEVDFTEAAYRALIRCAAAQYRFITFDQTDARPKSVLWRHDIDFSPHRARALARIEREEGITATYFVLLHSDFYNALELEVVRILNEIVSLGHRIGLHFDAGFYCRPDRRQTLVDELLADERALLEKIVGAAVSSFSWHVPSLGFELGDTERDEIAGMVNAYGPSIRGKFSYCSDSHGIWRFRRLADVVAAAEDAHLQVLTHAEWWVPDAMSPRDRVTRAIEGRAARQLRRYDELLEKMGRPNVR